MRKLLFILTLILSLWAFPAYAWMNIAVAGGGGGEGCSTPSGSVMDESFGDNSTACYAGATGNDATCIETWTVTGDSATFHHTLQAGAPAGSCTYGLLHDTSNENGERISWDNGSGIAYATSTDVFFSLYINSNTITNYGNIAIVSLGPASNYLNATGYVDVINNNGQLVIRARAAASVSTNVNISTSTWYTCKLHLDGTAANSYFKVSEVDTCDADSECTFTRSDNDKRYLVIGSLSGEGVSEAISFELGYIYVNNP